MTATLDEMCVEAGIVAGRSSTERRSVVSKVAAILRTFGFGGSLTVTEIAQISGLPLSTAHRLVVELASWQLLRRGSEGRYTLVDDRTIARRYTSCPSEIREAAAATVQDLSMATRSDVRLGLLDGFRVSYAEKTYGTKPFSDLSPAATLPAHATALGQVLLAFSAPAVVRHVIRHGLDRYTSCTLTTAARLEHALKVIRLHGIDVVSGELRRDHAAVAAPVFGLDGEIVAALEVRVRHVSVELSTVAPALTVAARAVSRVMGHTCPAEAAEEARSMATVVSLPPSAAPTVARSAR
jgi:DNA-binding IclR family transcriptional regulator